LAVHKGHWDILKENAKLLRGMGQQVELLDPLEIQHRWPYLRVSDLRGGSYTPQDGFAGPYEVLRGFARGARRLGADLREGVEATAIQVKNGQIQAVLTSSGDKIVTPLVVNAAGPFAARVAAMVGLELPVRPLRRQIFFTDPFGATPNLPMVIDLEYGWYVRREGPGLLLAGPQDSIETFNEAVDFEGMAWATTRSLYRMPVLEQARIARGWAGLYEISPDHHAIIGRFPEIKSFICANGFSGHGFQHSPAAGILVAELIVDGRARSLDISRLRPERFREKDLLHEPLTAFRDY
jgi:sarcosine oxidase subunit beta